MFNTLRKLLVNKALSRQVCPSCTRSLSKQRQRQPLSTDLELVTCKCGRKYQYDRLHRKYLPYSDTTRVAQMLSNV